MSLQEMLILVDSNDRMIGSGEKMMVHEQGLLHRAFSIFIFNNDGRLMLQNRARDKYHSAGLWTNTCCGHPRPRENTLAAARRRLLEEMGFDCELTEMKTISYRSDVQSNLIEHEYNHIFVGVFNGEPTPNLLEASDWRWIELPELYKRIRSNPAEFTVWFNTILNKYDEAEVRRWQRAASNRRRAIFGSPTTTYKAFLSEKWRAISSALDLAGPDADCTLARIVEAIAPWGDRQLGTRPPYRSFMSSDGFPAEFSVSWRGGIPEARITIESLGEQPTALSAQTAGQELTRRIASLPGVSIDRYLLVEDLFISPAPTVGRPTVWHAIGCRAGALPSFKVYLDPRAHGGGNEGDVAIEALDRLGLRRAWQKVGEQYAELRDRGHVLDLFALDLAPGEHSRVKLYFRHGPTTFAELDRIASFARHHDTRKLADIVGQIYGDAVTAGDDLISNEPLTCLALRQDVDQPNEANIYLRLPGAVASDAVAAQRIDQILQAQGINPGRHTRLMAALAPFDLTATSGIQQLLSFRTTGEREKADVGVYLRLNVYDQHD